MARPILTCSEGETRLALPAAPAVARLKMHPLHVADAGGPIHLDLVLLQGAALLGVVVDTPVPIIRFAGECTHSRNVARLVGVWAVSRRPRGLPREDVPSVRLPQRGLAAPGG